MKLTRLRFSHLSLAIVVIAVALTARLLTFERYLPYIDHHDETFRFLHAYQIRSDAPLGTQYGEVVWDEGFPPIQPWLAAQVQVWVEQLQPFPLPSDYVYAMRVVSLIAGVLTTIVVFAVGYLMGETPSARLIIGGTAALAWGLSPQVIATGTFALIDPLAFPQIALGLLAAVVSIREDFAVAAVMSLALAILAIYTKYLYLYTLWFPFCAVAVMIYRRGLRQSLPWLVGMATLSAITAGWLIWGHQALSLNNREATIFYDSGGSNMFSLMRNLDNLVFTLQDTFNLWLFLVTLAGAILVFIRFRTSVVHRGWLGMLLPVVVGCTLLTSSVDVLRDADPIWYRVRYMLPAAMMLFLVWGMALAQIWESLKSSRFVRLGLVAGLVAVFAIPAGNEVILRAQTFQQTHPIEVLWTYTDATLPEDVDVAILTYGGSKIRSTWNRPWSGYNGYTAFRWVYTDSLPTDRTPSDLLTDDRIGYLVATESDLMGAFGEGDAFIQELLQLKTLPPDPLLPETVYIYSFYQPEYRTRITFGDGIYLIGYDLSTIRVTPGETVSLRFFWQASQPATQPLSLFIHLTEPDTTQPLSQFDGAPATQDRPPQTWDDPAEILISEGASLVVPADIAPGRYQLVVGLYDYTTGERLSASEPLIIPLDIESE